MSRFVSTEIFREEWVDTAHNHIGINMTKEELYKLFDKRFDNSNITIYNSHRNTEETYSMLEFFNKIDKDGIIVIENGRFFYNQETILPPSVKITDDLMVDRKVYKKRSGVSAEKGLIDQSQTENRIQLILKVDGNTYYGIMNNSSSRFFNLDVGGSVTCAGRNGIALCALICEMTMGDYIHNNIDAVLHQFSCILMEEYRDISIQFLSEKRVTKQDVINKYCRDMMDNESFVTIVTDYINKLDQLSLNKLYYKNNMQLFISDIANDTRYAKIFEYINRNYNEVFPKVGTGNVRIMDAVYSDPFHYPKVLKEDFEELNILIRDILYGYYWYGGDYVKERKIMTNGMADTISIMDRNVILLVDTDSNMVLIDEMVQGILDKFSNYMPDMSDDYKWISASSLVNYFISIISDIGMTRYKYARNILPDYHKFMHIKNEFLYYNFMITSRKKNYIALMRVKEGYIFDEPELDIKGLSIKKAGFNENMCNTITEIIERDILRADIDNINLNNIMQIRQDAFNKMLKYLRSDRATEYLTVLKLGADLANFERGEHRVKAVSLWNNIFGNIELIIPPSSFYVAPLDINIEWLRQYKDVYRKLSIQLLDVIKYENIQKQMYRYCDKIPGILDIKPSYFKRVIDKVNSIDVSIPEEMTDTYEIDDYVENKYKYICATRKELEQEIFPELQEICKTYKKKDHDTKDNDLKFIMKVRHMDKYKTLTSNNKLTINKYFRKIAIPKAITELPEFIKVNINTEPYLSTFDNLMAPVLTEIGQVGVRMGDTSRVILTDAVQHF